MTSVKDRISNVILCEDVRHEIGNKKSLIGVYSGNVVVSEFPAQIQLALYFQVRVEPGEDPEKMQIFLYVDDLQAAEIAAELKVAKTENSAMVIPRAVFRFEKEGNFIVSVRLAESELIEILNKKIIKGPIAPR